MSGSFSVYASMKQEDEQTMQEHKEGYNKHGKGTQMIDTLTALSSTAQAVFQHKQQRTVSMFTPRERLSNLITTVVTPPSPSSFTVSRAGTHRQTSMTATAVPLLSLSSSTASYKRPTSPALSRLTGLTSSPRSSPRSSRHSSIKQHTNWSHRCSLMKYWQSYVDEMDEGQGSALGLRRGTTSSTCSPYSTIQRAPDSSAHGRMRRTSSLSGSNQHEHTTSTNGTAAWDGGSGGSGGSSASSGRTKTREELNQEKENRKIQRKTKKNEMKQILLQYTSCFMDRNMLSAPKMKVLAGDVVGHKDLLSNTMNRTTTGKVPTTLCLFCYLVRGAAFNHHMLFFYCYLL